MRHASLLDDLNSWVARASAALDPNYELSSRANREHGKWSGTVEIQTPDRLGYLTVWSSGELDCQVARVTDPPDFLLLNDHRFVESAEELERVLATFADVVT